MATNNIRDYSSIYTIKEFILEDIAPSYFNMEDVSLQNVGLFGMVTDIGATVAQDNFNVTSRYITELLPGKSVLPEFIYAEAANYGINDIFSHPSSCDAIIFIKESDILTYGEKNGIYTDYYIDSNMKVYIDDIIFQLPYDIRIRSKLYQGTYNHNCNYYDKNLNNSYVKLEYPYIKHIRTRINGENNPYIGLKVKLYQYTRRMVTESIITNNTLNIPYVDVPFENKLCNFEIIYKTPDGETSSQLIKMRDNEPAINLPFCYYKLIDENTLRISFTTDDLYFVPEYKSELEIYIYETIGVDGNFSRYNGDNIYVAGESSNDQYNYNNLVPLFCTMTTDAQDGDNGYSLAELNLLTWEAKLSLKSRSTDEDLNRYFNSFSALHDTKALFIKTRDDFATREYSCYTRIKDGTNIFPTNTLNLNLDFDDVGGFDSSKRRYTISPGQMIAYNNDSLTEAHIVKNLEDESDPTMIYTSIALINLELNPNNVSFYICSVDKTVDSDYKYINDEALYQFILKSFHIYRNSIKGEMGYHIKIVLLPSDVEVLDSTVYEDDYSGDTDGEVDETETNDEALFIQNLSPYLYSSSSQGRYIKMNYVSDESARDIGYTFECYIETNDMLSGDVLEILNMTSTDTQEVSPCGINITNPNFEVLVFYKEGEAKPHEYNYKIPDTNDKILCNVFMPNSNDYYLMYQLSLLKSNLSFIPSSGEPGFSMNLTGIPLFARDFIMEDDGNLSVAINQLVSQHEYIADSLNDLTSLFEIHMKLFNTFGKSSTFTLEDGNSLNRTYCDIKMGIKLFDGIDDVILNDIKITIKNYIEGLNNVEEDSINSISISQLIHIIHKEYSNEVDAVVFYSINGYSSDVQLISMKKDLSASENIISIPEFLTINTNDIILTTL